MASFTMTKRVKGTPDRVFEVFSDFNNAADLVSGIERIEMLTDGSLDVGTRFRETRIMFKREATEEMEITAFEPGKSFTVHCESCGCTYDSTFRFAPDGSETTVDVEFLCRPVTFFARLLSPLAVVTMGPMKKCINKDLEELKAVVENGAIRAS